MFPPDDLLLRVARSVERTDSTAPSIDEVDLVIALDALARAIIEHNRRLLSGERGAPVDWAVLTRPLRDAGRCEDCPSRSPESTDEHPGPRL